MIGRTISHYHVVERLGSGGMGVVYKAEDSRLGRFVALKILPEDAARMTGALERFHREARAASALNHPNICTIYDVGPYDTSAFIAMEYLEGSTLDRLVEAGPLSLERTLDIALDILKGLEAAHGAGILHRDVKPANIFVTRHGAKILDFGLAKITQARAGAVYEDVDTGEKVEQLSSIGGMLGTAAYMSPEQALGRPLDQRTDLFSFGVILYEMATGRKPFQGDTTASLLLSIVSQAPIAPVWLHPGSPKELESIINRCLQKDPDSRYQHASDIRRDLLGLNGGSRPQTVAQPGSPVPAETSESGKPAVATSLGHLIGPSGVRKRWTLIVSTSLAGTILLAGLWYSFSKPAVTLTQKDAIVVAAFANTTGDRVFDGALNQALAIQLAQSPFINVISDARVAKTLKAMDRPADERMTQAVAREVCVRTNSKVMVAGSIAKVGDRYLIGLTALGCEGDDTVASVAAEAKDRDEVLNALGHASRDLRRILGESLASLKQYGVRVEDVTTGSLEALQAYDLGCQLTKDKEEFRRGIDFFERATRLDPNFAMAYAQLARNYANVGDLSRSAENSKRAYDLRQRVSDHERFYIEAAYDLNVTEDLEAACRVCELWTQTYPRDVTALNWLGMIYGLLGELEKSVSTLREGVTVDPDDVIFYPNLATAYIRLNRLGEAEATIKEARARNLEFAGIHMASYMVAFLRHDAAQMAREASALATAGEVAGAYYESESAAYEGRMSRARELAAGVVADCRASGRNRLAGSYMAHAALREALVGNLAQARRDARSALGLSDNENAAAVSAIALALAGDPSRAGRIADGLSSQYSENRVIRFYYLPMIRAALAIRAGDHSQALKTLNADTRYDLAAQRGATFTRLYPVYLRAQASLDAGQAASAVAEFQKILGYRGLVWNDLIGTLAQLGLGRAYAGTGDVIRAKTAYQDFFASWKDADADVPILKEARAEYARLASRR